MRRPFVVPALLVASALAGCRSVDSATFASRPPRPADAEVRVFRTQQPACAYEEIGLVVWRPHEWWHSLDDGVRDMQQRARAMGGDAIVDFRYAEAATGVRTETSADSTRVTSTSRIVQEEVASGTVVRYLDGGC